jgi:hypothetical protein
VLTLGVVLVIAPTTLVPPMNGCLCEPFVIIDLLSNIKKAFQST